MIFIALIDTQAGEDDGAYEAMSGLRGDGVVTPLLIGRVFEESDILLLLHSREMEALDNYLIEHVRSIEASQELVVVPIYEFILLSAFDQIVEFGEESEEPAEAEAPAGPASEPDEELLMIMARVDVAPRMDAAVHAAVRSLEGDDGVVPLMTGHTFHSKEFDLVLFFLARDLEAAWEYGKAIRAIDGVWDTRFSVIAHFEPLVPLERFREYAAGGAT